MVVTIVLISFILLVLAFAAKQFLWPSRLKNIENKHVVVTGGSSGIGRCVAILAAKQGAHVTIIARDVQKLEATKNDLMRVCKNKDTQKIEYLPLDISQNYVQVETALFDLEKTMGPIFMLVNCAGLALCGKIEDTSIEDLHKMINVNFIGTYYCIKAVVQKMKAARQGIIVLTSSQAALVGIFGFSGYCGSKFALRGLAESLSMEVSSHGISVTLCVPPDTDTPGFATEELTKPLETKLICDRAGLINPKVVADQLMKDAMAGKFFSTVGMEGFILTTLCAGMAPFTSLCELLLQSAVMGILRIVSAGYHMSFQKIIVNCMKIRDKNKKSE